MIIKKLIIKNIASIQDATIEFDKAPLADNPLFLISGETGSGKTTILNAICLALYNNAPYLDDMGAPNDKDREGNTISNSCQLMRRGTGEASVELSYTGNDGLDYVARWNQRRARNKASGKLQGVVRTLACQGKETLNGQEDIKAAVQDSVGLDFGQFCRTTLLAQGQFSKFINSKEQEKTAILEKLTGTEEYAQIGKKIFETSKAKAADYEKQKAKMEGITLMTTEEKAACHTAIEAAESDIKALRSRSVVLSTLIQWLDDFDKAKTALDKAKVALGSLETQRDGEEFKAKRRDVDLWDKTASIRETMKRERADEAALADKQGRLSAKKSECIRLVSGVKWTQAQKSIEEKKIEELQSHIREDAPNKGMYDALGVIDTHIEAIGKKQADKDNALAAVASAETLKGKLDIAATQSSAETAAKQLAAQQAVVEGLTSEMEGTDIAGLTKAVTSDTELIVSIDKASAAVQAFHEGQTRISDADKSLNDKKKDLALHQKDKEGKSQQLPKAKSDYEALFNRCQGMKSLAEHLAEIGRQFADTETCPLCGSHVHNLHSESILDEDLRVATEAADKAKADYDAIRNAVITSEVAISQLTKDIGVGESRLAADKAELALTEKKAQQSAKAVGVEYAEADAKDKLSTLQAETDKRKEVDVKVLDDATAKSAALTAATKELDKLRKGKEAADKKLTEVNRQMTVLDNEIRTNNGFADKAEADIRFDLGELEKSVSISVDWDNVNLTSLRVELHNMAGQYTAWGTELASRQQVVSTFDSTLSSLGNNVERMTSALGIDAGTIVSLIEVPDLISSFRSFVQGVDSLQGEIRATDKAVTEDKTAIDAYFSSRPEPRRDAVEALKEDHIASCKKELEALVSAISSSKGATQTLQSQMDDLIAKKPEMEEGVDKEVLATDKDSVDAQLKEKAESQAALHARLTMDAANQAKVADQASVLEALGKIKNDWATLESIFGGADGGKFRKIAQSYVLGAMLRKANYYMEMLTQRYELECDGDSLSINVIDHNQGGSIRSACSLSGGEGFIASLALALGLSAISKDKIGVDTLFIDEGFGTLSEDLLDVVINTLDKIHQSGGRRVGVISHVAKLAERIPTQIQVIRNGTSSSKVEVVSR